MPATLVLVRHGEIVRPTDTSNFDPAPLTDRGRAQIAALAAAWPVEPPAALYASPLRRAIESAQVLAEAFGLPIVVRPCLQEWSPDASGIPQAAYLALEAGAWADLNLVPPGGESLRMAGARARTCVEHVARDRPDGTSVLMGHGTLFSLLTASLKAARPTAAYKASVGFGHAAILGAGSGLRLVRDFAPYGTSS
ncbi:MAG: histidine phosphatase family protein [Methanobacteriota archaeon]